MMKPLRLPPGFQFTPSDSDLILHYLTKKINGEPIPIVNLIKDRDLYGKETPFMIYESCSSSFDSSVFNKWMYFFTKIKKKFTGNPCAKRIDRIVGNGSWKVSNTTKVYYENNNKSLHIGYKTLLNFIVKSPEKEINTNEKMQQPNSWILYEYTLKGSNDVIDNDSIWVVCKFRKGGKLRKHSHDNPLSLRRERPPSSAVNEDDDDDDDCSVPKKKRICYRGSSSAFNKKNKYVEGLVVEGQQQCVADQHNVDDWLCVPTEDECQTETALILSSYSYPLNSETDQQQYTSDKTLFCNPSGDDCNSFYPLSPLTTFNDLPSFYEYNSQQPLQIGADNNAITSSCWNECETLSTSSVSKEGAPTQTLTGVSITDDAESSLAAQLDDQCAYSTVNEEKIWSPEDWKELELMLFSGIESL